MPTYHLIDAPDDAPETDIDDADHYYLIGRLPGYINGIHDGAGVDLEQCPAPRTAWWRRPGGPAQHPVRCRRGPTRTVTGYRLRDGVSIDGQPATLTPEQWHDLDEDSPYVSLYEPVIEEQPPPAPSDADNVTDVRDSVPLIGRPAPELPAGVEWHPRMIDELRWHPEYHHLLPGQLLGIHRHLANVLGARPGVSAYNNKGLTAYVTVSKPPLPNGKRRKVNEPGTASIHLDFPAADFPDRVTAANLDAAVAVLEDVESRALAMTAAAGFTQCPACNASGLLTHDEARRVVDQLAK